MLWQKQLKIWNWLFWSLLTLLHRNTFGKPIRAVEHFHALWSDNNSGNQTQFRFESGCDQMFYTRTAWPQKPNFSFKYLVFKYLFKNKLNLVQIRYTSILMMRTLSVCFYNWVLQSEVLFHENVWNTHNFEKQTNFCDVTMGNCW